MNKIELAEKHILINRQSVDTKVSMALNVFWLGFIVYTSAYTISTIPPYNTMWQKVQLAAFVLLVGSSLSLVKFRITNSYLRLVYNLYLLWLCFIVVRGFEFNYEFISNTIYDAWFGVLLYFIPVIVLFQLNIESLRKVFWVIIILGIVFLGYCFLFRGQLLANYEEDTGRNQYVIEYLARNLSVPAGFLLLTYPYQSFWKKVFAFFIVGVTLLLALIRARRAIIFMEASYLLCFYFIFLYINKIKFQALFFSLILIGALVFGGIKMYNKYKGDAFEFITERIGEDTRTGVEVCLYDDLTTKDWIFGKGMSGQYYCPGIDDGVFNDYRNMIETDYLNIILKGGIISLALLLLITIPAAILGIFYSKNLISKAAGIWIFLWVTDLYPTVVTTFALQYVLVWIAVGICYSREIRNMAEEEVKELLSNKKPKASFI